GRHPRALRRRVRRRQLAGEKAEPTAAHDRGRGRRRYAGARADGRRLESGPLRRSRRRLPLRMGDVRLLRGARSDRVAGGASARPLRRPSEPAGRVIDISAQSALMRWGVLAVCCGLSVTASHAALPPEVERVLSAHGIPHDAVSIVVQSVDSDTPLLSHLPDTARNPASVMKVVTTWAGLELLGPAYQWRTEAYLLGGFDGRVLDGDLALKGYGDPELVLEEFWKLLRGLRRTGLQEIRGDLVLDDTYFEVSEDDPGAFDGQPSRAYNVVPNALLVNFKTVLFQFYAEPLGKRVRVVTEPPLPNLQVRNGLELVEGPCRGYQAGINLQIPDAAASRVQLSGQFPSRCNYYELSRAVLAHDAYAYGLFRTLWDELGGELRGTSRSAPVQEGARPALSWRSAPLGEVI